MSVEATIIISVIGWIITICVAVYTVRSSSKETDMKIAALEDSTTKQVESIKQLAKLQIKTCLIQINKELWGARMRSLQASQKKGDMIEYNNHFNHFGDGPDYFRRQHEKESELSSEQEFQAKYAKVLEEYQTDLNKLSKELEG